MDLKKNIYSNPVIMMVEKQWIRKIEMRRRRCWWKSFEAQ